jgi:ATP-dependent DNA helicase RecQ
MNSIAFVDTEIEPKSRKILDIGSIKGDGSSFHKASVAEFTQFLNGTQFICGHNIFNHDIKYIGQAIKDAGIGPANMIDTLYLSPLLFPTKPYHALLKDDKLQSEDVNNPLNDSIKAKDLFYDEIAAFKQVDETLKEIFYLLLNSRKEFHAFFHFIEYVNTSMELESLIRKNFKNEICEQVDLAKIISEHPVELAYCLSLINSFIQCNKIHSITPPWVLKNYPEVERIMFRLRNKPCISGCVYCNNALDVHRGLKRFFGFGTFRTYGSEPLQEQAVKAAVDNK